MDYSSKDDLLEAVKAREFDYIVPTCNDYSYMSAAWAAQHCGFPGFDSFETTMILHNKQHFRKFMSKWDLPVPLAMGLDENVSLSDCPLNLPLLVKPADSSSGKGVTKVICRDELEGAVKVALDASPCRGAVIEEFIEGSLHSHSAFIRGQGIALDFFVDEFCTIYPYQVNCSNHPSALSEDIRAKIRVIMKRMIQRLNLTDGLLHTQFMVKGDQVWIIECMRRSPGDLYGQLIGASTGVDYADLYTRPFVGEDLPNDVDLGPPKLMGRHTVSCDKAQVIADFSHTLPGKNVRIVPLKSSGEHLDVAPYDKLAILFIEFECLKQMHDATQKLEKFVSIRPMGDS